jgi:exodeoxyribonuclease V alpha subunit
VRVDLRTIRPPPRRRRRDVDVRALPWPEPGAWLERRPARWSAPGGTRTRRTAAAPRRRALYLDRYWREERRSPPTSRAAARRDGVDEPAPRRLRRLFADEAATAPGRRGAAVRGASRSSPAARARQDDDGRAHRRRCWPSRPVAAGRPAPLVALAAPTGKAAARLEEAVHAEARDLDVAPGVREQLAGAGRLDPAPPARMAAGQPQPLPATTAPTACPTTSSWSTRRRWSRCR